MGIDFNAAGTARVETDYPDGRLEYFDAQGRTIRLERPDGTSTETTWSSDGTSTIRDFGVGRVLTREQARAADATVLWTREVASDGTAVKTYADGTVEHYRADGSLADRHLPNGDVQSYLPDGSAAFYRADGTLGQRRLADGRLETYDAAGTHVLRVDLPDGVRLWSQQAPGLGVFESLEAYRGYRAFLTTWQRAAEDGVRGPSTSFRMDPDGHVVEQLADGRMLGFHANGDGSVAVLDDESGTQALIMEHDGQIEVHAAGGVAMFNAANLLQNADGSLTVSGPNGATDTWYGDGRHTHAAGGVVARYLENADDGTDTLQSETDATQVTAYYRADGTLTLRTFGDGSRETPQPGGCLVRQDQRPRRSSRTSSSRCRC